MLSQIVQYMSLSIHDIRIGGSNTSVSLFISVSMIPRDNAAIYMTWDVCGYLIYEYVRVDICLCIALWLVIQIELKPSLFIGPSCLYLSYSTRRKRVV